MKTRLRVWKGEQDISDELELRDRKALPGGWSQAQLVYIPKDQTGHPSAEEFVGWIESGIPMDFADGFRFEVVPLLEAIG